MSERPETTQSGQAPTSRDDFVVVAPKTEAVSPRGMLIGVGLFCVLALSGLWWRMAGEPPTRDRLTDLEFSVQEPDKQKFEFKDPIRDIIKETPIKPDQEIPDEPKPDVNIPVPPTEVTVVEDVVQARKIAIDAPNVQWERNRDMTFDAPEEISEASEKIEYAIQPIAVRAPAGGDLFQYRRPPPPGAVTRHVVNTAPRAGRGLAVLPKSFGEQDGPSLSALPPLTVNLFSGDFSRSMTRFGGLRARSAVDSALHWLATHQETDGYWDPRKYEGSGSYVGATGLSLLSLMGGGHTARRGEYRRNVLRGLEWLLNRQRFSGQMGDALDEHAVATIALCESYGRTPEERIGAAARKAVVFLEKAVSRDDGWGIRPDSTMSDLATTAWAMQALKAARLAQLPVDHGITSRALVYLDSLSDKNAGPDTNGKVTATAGALQQAGARPATNLLFTGAAMLIRQFNGVGVSSVVLTRGAEWLRRSPPDWKDKDFAHWYYATYAMHNMGGEDRVWWNRRIRDVLLNHQRRDGEEAGSWDPAGDLLGQEGGRVAVTATGALILEVYYRYSDALSSFGVAPDLDELLFQ